ITAAYHKETNQLLGVNVFGIRLRHAVLDAWLSQHKSLDYCLAHWADALFDPEFSNSHQKDLLNHYNTVFQKALKPVKKSWTKIFNPFSTKK
ncbi:MAG: NAD(P)/FAD-dependent oxidoreductase, partial [Flavobacteriaceae bacterium]|nr:NAD(P)/FAD-dependent oxidoreductase [Flavobacteriaceae bacterium]